jgi:hypothetical protein
MEPGSRSQTVALRGWCADETSSFCIGTKHTFHRIFAAVTNKSLFRLSSNTSVPYTHCGVQTVDYAVVNEMFAQGTGNRSATWGQAVMNWHRMTAQLPHHEGGLGLTPQRASGIATFYSASCTFLGWLAQRPHRQQWLRQGQLLHDHEAWTAKQPTY